MEHTKTKDTLLFQNLDSNLSTEEERRGQISTKVKQNKKENKQFVDNLRKLLSGDKKSASKPLLIGVLPNILRICCQKSNITTPSNTNMYINKSTIEKVMRPEVRDINGKRTKISGHYLTEKQIIVALNELKYPCIILKGSKENTLVAVTNFKDDTEQEIIITMAFNKNGTIEKICNITSIYGRENFKQYIINNFENNNILAINKEKANELLLSIGVDFPEANTIISFDDSIAYTFENVNIGFQ